LSISTAELENDDMKLIDVLKSKESGNSLADRLVNVRRVASHKLDHTRDLFPNFTDHTIRHCDNVVEILDKLVPDEIKDQLNAWELYFMIAATYLHDIGMVEGCPQTPTGKDWMEFLDSFRESHESDQTLDETSLELNARREYVRDHHHERSEEYIRQNWQELELRESDTHHEGHIVGRIALGHRIADLSDRNQFGEVPFGNNQLIRRDLLGAYLRLADELDTTAFRTPWAEYEVLDFYDESSELEWGKHLSISGYSVFQGTIRITGVCYDHAIFLRLQRLEKEINKKLVEIKRMLPKPYASGDGFRVDDPVPFHTVELDIEHMGYLPIDIKFELEHEQIVKLIMGERLYGDPTACIRELLQNAVDTCKEAEEHRPRGWIPEIIVSLDNEQKTISVHDNGMGMDEDIIRQYFARVGLSYYRSEQFEGKFNPVSEFGIGILSCFMLADGIEVDSKKQSADPIHLRIRSLTDSFIPRIGDRTDNGTTVLLHLKPEFQFDHLRIAQIVRYHARHVEFPIAIVEGEEKILVKEEGLVPYYDDIQSISYQFTRDTSLEPAVDRNDKKSHIELQRDGVQLGITLLDDLIEKRHLDLSERVGMLSQYGFRVGPIERKHLPHVDTWCEINLTGNSILPLTVTSRQVV